MTTFRNEARLLLLLLPPLAAAQGCLVRPVTPTPVGHATAHVPGIRIIQRAQARARGLIGRPFDFPFGDNQDGTKLVLDFLAEARKAGADFVSDIRIVMASQRQGRAVRCETRLLAVAREEVEKVPHRTPGRTETKMVPKMVTRTVTEYQYRCRGVSRPVTRMETRYEYRYDYASKSSRSVPVTRMVTHYEYRNECRSEPVTRTVTRYEYQLQTRYIPPQLTYLSARYTDFNLVEARPVCRPAAPPGRDRPPHRITGLIYRSSKKAAIERPETEPSRCS